MTFRKVTCPDGTVNVWWTREELQKNGSRCEMETPHNMPAEAADAWIAAAQSREISRGFVAAAGMTAHDTARALTLAAE